MNREYGIKNSTTTPVNASANWWGDDSGPSNAANNPDGTGDQITDNVTFSPLNDGLAIGLSWQNFSANAGSTYGPDTLLPAITRGSASDEWDPYSKRPERTVVMDPEEVQLKYNNLDSTAYYKIRVTFV